MTGPYGIPYEELAMQQQEAKESLPYTMREVRQALVKLPPKDRHGIIFALDSGQAEIERLTELIESRDAEIHAMYTPVVEALLECKREFRMLDKVDINTTHWGDLVDMIGSALAAIKEVKG